MRIATVCVLALSLAELVMGGQGKGKGKGKNAERDEREAAVMPAGMENARFGTVEVRIISDYYQRYPQQLPPGLQKKLRRGGTLPPGWQKKMQAFPGELEGRLPRVPYGCHRVVSGQVALLIQDSTNVVLDILELMR